MDASFQVDYLREYHLAVCRPIGSLTEERAEKLFYFLTGAEEAASDTFNRLLDLTLVTGFPLQSAVIHRYANIRREAVEHFPPFRTAIIIAADPDAEALAGIYKALMKGSKISVGIFGNAKSATDWLGVPEKVVEPQTAEHS